MIEAFIGTMGSGKTLSAVYECYKYHRLGYKVFSNIKLSFPHEWLNMKMLVEMKKNRVQLKNAVLFLDEGHQALDSRSSMKDRNKAITYAILMSRKLSIKFLVTTQHLHQIDKRLRDSIDIVVFCRNLTNKQSVVKEEDKHRPVYILQEFVLQWAEDMKPRRRILLANPVFGLYDTEYIVDVNEEIGD